MKNFKTIFFIALALALLPLLFSFRTEKGIKEYGTIQFIETQKKDAIIIHLSGEVKKISTESFNDEGKLLEVINTFSQAGWIVRSSDCNATGTYIKRIIYLERPGKR